MSRILLLLCVISLCFSCGEIPSTPKYVLTRDERTACDSARIDTTIVILLRDHTKGGVERFHYSPGRMYKDGKEYEIDPIKLNGLVVSEPAASSYPLVFALKDTLRKLGYSIFLLDNNFGIDNKNDVVGLLKITDKFEVLQKIQTNGINYDIDTDSLVKVMRNFDKELQLELVGASGDWCEFVIHKDPADWLEFARRVYAVCPDVVEQGTDTVEALAEEMKKSKRLYFWWD